MNYVSKVFLSGFVVLLGIFAAACPDRTSIGDIEANPSRYQNKEVAIAGTVQDSYGVNWNGRNYGLGIYEKDRRFTKR